jgi:hypothetical protein
MSPFFVRQHILNMGQLNEHINQIFNIPAFANLPLANLHQLRASLNNEFASYLILADAIDEIDNENEGGTNFDLLAWWFTVRRRIPTWYSLLLEVVIFQPSSAAAERVFSLLDAFFGSKRESCLEDLKEGSVMLRYNEVKRRLNH